MALALAHRLLLRKVLVLRRVSSGQEVELDFLIRSLEDDEELIRKTRPDLYINGSDWDMSAVVRDCLEDGIIELRPPGALARFSKVIRTRLGDNFIKGLEPLLAELADEAPMSGKDLLEWLARM